MLRPRNAPTMSAVQYAVAHWHGLTLADLLGGGRHRRVAQARQEGYWLARHVAGRSSPAIARAFGQRDHTTILYGIAETEIRRQTEPQVYARLQYITRTLQERAYATADLAA